MYCGKNIAQSVETVGRMAAFFAAPSGGAVYRVWLIDGFALIGGVRDEFLGGLNATVMGNRCLISGNTRSIDTCST